MLNSKLKHRRRWVKYTAFFLIFITVLFWGIFWPTWPSKAKLCQDLESYISKTECMNLEHRVAIVEQAFPLETTSSEDVKNALEEYLQNETPTSFGHIETYHLSVRPIGYFLKYQDAFSFSYDTDGMLFRITHQD